MGGRRSRAGRVGLLALVVIGVAACGPGDKHPSSSADRRDADVAATPTTSAVTSTSTTTVASVPAETLAVAPGTGRPVATNGVLAEPNAALTPGAVDPRVTQANIGSTICVSGYTATVRPPSSYTSRVKAAQLSAYGYAMPASDFELDHLVPLELGGAPSSVANLWPEPLEKAGLVGEGFGAETKDQFENYLHRAVCAGRIALADAQRRMATHWIAAAQAVGIAAGAQADPITTTTAAPATTITTAPASGGCTPGYDPCIPPGDDVDCAGGGGDGPRYVEGPVRVDPAGGDPYGLDGNHDGVGCTS